MQLRSAPVVICLALLSASTAVVDSSAPLAFADGGRRTRPLRTAPLLRAAPADPDGPPSSPSEFAPDGPPRPQVCHVASTSTRPRGVSSRGTVSIADAEREFEVNLGRAVDTLKSDYPALLTANPSWHIYHTDLEVIDPTGVSLHGLENYKKAFTFIHGVVKWFYCEEKSSLTSIRVGYDWARKCIRVSWNVEMVPKMIYGGTRNTLHVDGISEYYLDRDSGLINEHRVSHLLINNQPVQPERGVFHALAEMTPAEGAVGVPAFSKQEQAKWEDSLTNQVVKFQAWTPPFRRPTSLFAGHNDAMPLPSEGGASSELSYDLDAFQRKNQSRKKFGVPPLTPEEFVKIEEEVRAMAEVQKKKAAYLAEQLREEAAAKENKAESFLSNLFGGALKNGCESNFDCERPKVCCDVGFKKYCCSDGLGIVEGIPVEQYKRAPQRVTMGNDNYDRNPFPRPNN